MMPTPECSLVPRTARALRRTRMYTRTADQMAGWLVGWMVVWLDSCLVGWLLAGWFAGCQLSMACGSNNTGELCNTRYGMARKKGSVGEKRGWVAGIVRERVKPRLVCLTLPRSSSSHPRVARCLLIAFQLALANFGVFACFYLIFIIEW